MSDILNLILGTAGHIDHGKSTLVKRLTGVDPDRLKEEQERGMTIDLGFAPFRLPDGRRVGIIDVPGHERFVKNMVAGATGIDCVILVVAADDGVMPQTREHLDIMSLLGIEKGLVALTKIDAVEEDLAEIVAEELGEFLKGTFLEGAPIVPVSSLTGAGIEELTGHLVRLLGETAEQGVEGVFRMPIQRVFSKKGYGTVVTGIPVSGKTCPGDAIEILPSGASGRVRGIQSYMESSDIARAGRSCALNVTDVEYSQVHRGQVAAAPGFFAPETLVEGRLELLASLKKPLANFAEVRLHTGTAEILGHVVLLDSKVLAPGETALVQLRLEEPAVVAPGDRFVLRLHSPMITIGGGTLFGPSRRKLKRFKSTVIDELAAREGALSDRSEAVVLSVLQSGLKPVRRSDLAHDAKLDGADLEAILESLKARGVLCEVAPAQFVHAGALAEFGKRIVGEVRSFHRTHPYRLFMEKLELKNRIGIKNVAVFDRAVADLVAAGALVEEVDRLRLAEHEIRFTDAEVQTLAEMEARFDEAAFNTPRPDQIPESLSVSRETADQLLEVLIEKGVLVRIDPQVILHRKRVEEARQLVVSQIEADGELISGTFRDRLATTRKYVIPLLDYFDQIGLTVREGSKRVLRKYGRASQ